MVTTGAHGGWNHHKAYGDERLPAEYRGDDAGVREQASCLPWREACTVSPDWAWIDSGSGKARAWYNKNFIATDLVHLDVNETAADHDLVVSADGSRITGTIDAGDGTTIKLNLTARRQ